MISANDKIEFMRKWAAVPPRDYEIYTKSSHGSYLSTSIGYLLDLACFHGSRLIGYNHLSIRNSVKFGERLNNAALTKTANPDYVTDELYRYYEALVDIAPKCLKNDDMRVFVVNSGAEAVENALKHCIVKTGGKYFISFQGGFHGRTVFTLANTHMPHNLKAHQTFSSFSRGSAKAWVPQSLSEIEFAIAHLGALLKYDMPCAGIIIEPIQGAGGHRIFPQTFLHELSEFAHRHNVPLIIDEVQTGGGGSGEMWMSDKLDLPHRPECIVGGKRLGCGVVYMADSSSMGYLDTTWGGNLADMVRVVAELEILKNEDLLSKVDAKHDVFMSGLLRLAKMYPAYVKNPRGVGLLLGFDTCSRMSRDRLDKECLLQELLVMPAGITAIRFRPSVGITFSDINTALVRLEKALQKMP